MDPPTLVELNQSNEERKGRVRTEMLKPEETEKPRILTEIVRDIWADNHIPETCKTGLIIKLPKKGGYVKGNAKSEGNRRTFAHGRLFNLHPKVDSGAD